MRWSITGRKLAVAAALVVVGTALAPSPASARWAVWTHPLQAIDYFTEPGLAEGETCGREIRGRVGAFVDGPEPAFDASDPRFTRSWRLQAWTNGGPWRPEWHSEDGLGLLVLFDVDDEVIPESGRTIAGPMTFEPEPVQVSEMGDRWLVSSAEFALAIAGPVEPGDHISVNVDAGDYGWTSFTVVDCGPPPPVPARVDVVPGLSTNYVVPTSGLPLPVLVHGSDDLDVDDIESLRLGSASPIPWPWFLRFLDRRFDADRDGHTDRLAWFRTDQTGLTCASTSVSVDGTLADGRTFAASDSVRPVFCRR